MKAKKIITIVVTAMAVAMTVFSGIMKLLGNKEMMDTLSAMGVGPYVPVLGVMEIVFAGLFVYPKTMKIGFILLVCYFAGALGAELSHGTPLNALLPMTLVWIAAFLRDSSIFIPGRASI